MSRPPVSVVVPFSGSAVEAADVVQVLGGLAVAPGDEVIIADNSPGAVVPAEGRLRVVRVDDERSPAHARNAGAAHARGDWILFLDADTRAPRDLLDRFFAEPIADGVGALAGAVTGAPGGASLAARYGAARSFLDHDAHLAHPYLPRAVAANLLVRRAAFEAIGGFSEGVRAAEDTDFSWRLQRAGWRLEGRSRAGVEHRYRTTVGDLRRQWRGYAAGRAWLGRRYEDFRPEPALARAVRRVRARHDPPPRPPRPSRPVPARPAPVDVARAPAPGRQRAKGHPLDRAAFLALDALLGVEELAGFALSNRPASEAARPARVVLVAERFPAAGDPRSELALTIRGARVEAAARPEALDGRLAGAVAVAYREDDGVAARWSAMLTLARRHPLRCFWDVVRRDPGDPRLTALAPAVVRLERDRDARLHPLTPGSARATAVRLARLTGSPLDA